MTPLSHHSTQYINPLYSRFSCRLFGTLLVISFCDLTFIMKHFKFLKTVAGKGFFNLFLASMFLVGTDGNLWGYVMTGVLAGLGLFFILVGCACIKGYEDMTKKDVKKAGGEMAPETENSALMARQNNP